ncbi:hypothetical protein GCM10010387_32260 [Streptomyces inusitatus]|uniref:DUF7224 domain-containing protein n=1 Tax=Streptomyces inusitatus TaxID=68221 RepID=A0A918Q804_9ACTN|nr:hypothetical protein [Streptomyces inusitatus]GGZ35699.1 hypothetical protein GCM10010387_32260 [Streptomyces inusitatus]
MRLATLLRSGSAVWAALLLIGGLLFFSTGNTGGGIEYWESVTAQSTGLLGVISAVCGAGAAWEATRLKRGAVSTWAPSRGPLRIAAEQLAPMALLGLAGVLISLAIFSDAALLDIPGRPNLTVLAVGYSVVLSHIALGFLLGGVLPRLLGPPLMLILGYFWGFWPAALAEPAWLRHLNGQGIGECCRLDQVPAPRSLGATALFSATVITVALILIAARQGKARLVLPMAVAVTGVAASIAVAFPLGLDGEHNRDQSLLRCSGSGSGSAPQVCLWPEQYEHEDDFVRWSKEAGDKLRKAGLTPVERVEFSWRVPDRETVLIVTATSLLPSGPPACALEPGETYPGSEAASALDAWLAQVVGVEPAASSGSDEAAQLAQKVRAMPAEAQKAWFQRNLRSVLDCSQKPELSPSSYTRAARAGS